MDDQLQTNLSANQLQYLPDLGMDLNNQIKQKLALLKEKKEALAKGHIQSIISETDKLLSLMNVDEQMKIISYELLLRLKKEQDEHNEKIQLVIDQLRKEQQGLKQKLVKMQVNLANKVILLDEQKQKTKQANKKLTEAEAKIYNLWQKQFLSEGQNRRKLEQRDKQIQRLKFKAFKKQPRQKLYSEVQISEREYSSARKSSRMYRQGQTQTEQNQDDKFQFDYEQMFNRNNIQSRLKSKDKIVYNNQEDECRKKYALFNDTYFKIADQSFRFFCMYGKGNVQPVRSSIRLTIPNFSHLSNSTQLIRLMKEYLTLKQQLRNYLQKNNKKSELYCDIQNLLSKNPTLSNNSKVSDIYNRSQGLLDDIKNAAYAVKQKNKPSRSAYLSYLKDLIGKQFYRRFELPRMKLKIDPFVANYLWNQITITLINLFKIQGQKFQQQAE